MIRFFMKGSAQALNIILSLLAFFIALPFAILLYTILWTCGVEDGTLSDMD
jgi:phage shock protein PspC (stress-responsive transcriptional regulator)